MEKRIFILFSVMLISAFFVSGCPDGQTKTEVESIDLLVIRDVIAIPSAELKDSSKLVVRMEVQNVGQNELWMLLDDDSQSTIKCDPEKKEDCFDGDMVLVDHCEALYPLTDFSVVSEAGKVCGDPNYNIRLGGTKEAISSEEGCYLKFDPHQVHIFQWKVNTPAKSDIGGLVNECDFNLQTIYSAKAETMAYVYFAVPQEVAQRVYTGRDLTLVGDNVASYGPVVANFETGEAQPITAGRDNDGKPDTWSVYLNLKNLGSGIAKIDSIKLEYDSGISPSDDCELIEEGGAAHRSASTIKESIEDYRDKSITACIKKYEERSKKEADTCKARCEAVYDACLVACSMTVGPLCSATCQASKESCLAGCGSSSGDADDRCKDAGCDYLEPEEEKKKCENAELLEGKLEIFKTESSRISCTMNVPGKVVIMQPYKFITTATYAYSQGRSLRIKTKPHVA